jgi:transcriptional regulator with XRE-family HTH domain
VESGISKGLAYQLRAMREARNWSQEELAALVGMPQTAISRLESPNYGKATVTTLKRVARVYDVGLDIRFVPFSLLVDRMSKTPRVDMGLTSDSIDVPSFEEEVSQGAFDNQPSTIVPTDVRNLQFQFRAPVNPESYWGAFHAGRQFVTGIAGIAGTAPLRYVTAKDRNAPVPVNEYLMGTAKPVTYVFNSLPASSAPLLPRPAYGEISPWLAEKFSQPQFGQDQSS